MAALRCHLNCAKTKVTAQLRLWICAENTDALPISFRIYPQCKIACADLCALPRVRTWSETHFDMVTCCAPTRCCIATPRITMFAGRTERGLGHGDPEDHRNVEQTTPLLGHRHRRACTETVDDGVAAFFLEATHVHAGDVDPSVCDSVCVPFRLPRGRLRDGVWLRGASTALDRRCHG